MELFFDIETVFTVNWIVEYWQNWIAWNKKGFAQLNYTYI